MTEQTQKIDIWAIVELFGHQKIAGHCTEQNIAGANMLRVDVPETKNNPAFTRLLNHAAVYAINPVTEEVARFYAQNLNTKPIEAWDIREFQKKAMQIGCADPVRISDLPQTSPNDPDSDFIPNF